MVLLLTGIAVIIGSGFVALLTQSAPRLSSRLGAGGIILGSVIGISSATRVFLAGSSESFFFPWNVPYGSFSVGMDPLSAFFLLPVLALSSLGALYATEYLSSYHGKRPIGAHWFFFSLLVAGMAMVILARNGVLFLVSWEIMSVASFFLVTFEDEKESVQRAGWTYLIAAHLGVTFLLALFVLLGQQSGSLDFDAILMNPPVGVAGIFILAVIGFGSKAGFLPFHVWLPEAHPAAPSHVSAIMSGVMIKTGIYGLLRTLTFLGTPPVWWGYVLLGIGLMTGISGVIFSLAQQDLKRLLAYSSIENIGIIAIGLGVGLLGVSFGSPAVAVLGFGGGLLHVLNHALFKGLLFLGAGSILHSTGTRNLDLLGGLLKSMPWTGTTFLLGSVAICGLPPLNGFMSEVLIYFGAFRGGISNDAHLSGPLLLAVAGLALIGGLASACFTKAFGVVFLGEPRSPKIGCQEAGPAMIIPMVILAVSCILIGLSGPLTLRLLIPVVKSVVGFPENVLRAEFERVRWSLSMITYGGCGLLLMFTTLFIIRRCLLRKRCIGHAVTWDCGYAKPSSRMQYTASSFSQPLTSSFLPILRTRRRASLPNGFFPKAASLRTETPDVFRQRFFEPAFRGVKWALWQLRWLQHGRVQLYVLYIAVAAVALFVWKLR